MAQAFAVGVPLGMLLLMWWVFWFGSIVVQCNPIAMHLAPAMRTRALRVTVALWTLITIAMTLVIGVPIGHPGQVAVFTGLVLMETTATLNMWRLAALFGANWLLWNSGPQVAAWYAAFLRSDTSVLLGVLLIVIDGRIALRRMFGGTRRLPLAVAPKQVLWDPETPPLDTLMSRLFVSLDGARAHRQPLFVQVLGNGQFGGGRRFAFVLLLGVCIVMRAWTCAEAARPIQNCWSRDMWC